jgi:fucose permease
MTGSPWLLVTTLTSALVAGVLLRLAHGLKSPLAQSLEVTEKPLRALTAFTALVLVPMTLAGGWLIDTWGISAVLLTGCLLGALGLAGLMASQSYVHVLGSMLLVATGGAWLATTSVVLMPAALFEKSPTGSANLGFVLLGLGMLLAPVLAEALPRKLGFRRSFALLALLCLLPGFLVMFAPRAELVRQSSGEELSRVLGEPVLWLAGAALFFYWALEAAASSRTKAYLSDLGYPERAAATLWVGFCLAFLLMRLLTGYLLVEGSFLIHHSEPWWILMLVLIAAITLGNLVGSYNPAPAGLGVLLTGACLGPVFPTLAGMVLQRFPEQRGTAIGALFALGAAGELLLTPLLNAHARRQPARQSLRVLMILALLLTAPLLVLGLVH